MISIAVLGYGTVGSGVVDVMTTNSDNITTAVGDELYVKYIMVRRKREEGPFIDRMVQSFDIIENDPEVRIVVEVMGGMDAAYDYTVRALRAKKSVVTANKELIANHGDEIIKIAKENGVNYMFEASVGGGIPILTPIAQCLQANKIDGFYGIVNGTTNYILTEMASKGVSFDDALSDAAEKGYAEADPTADIEGHDACRKVCILAAMCFGSQVYPHQVKTEGITKLCARDVYWANRMGGKIKLIGRAVLRDGKVAAYVAPHVVKNENLISNVDGVMNGIAVSGNAIGEVVFYGAGAGKLPTASAAVSDIIDSAKHLHRPRNIEWGAGSEDMCMDADMLESQWLVRMKGDIDEASVYFGSVTVLGCDPTETGVLTAPANKYKIDSAAETLGIVSALRVL